MDGVSLYRSNFAVTQWTAATLAVNAAAHCGAVIVSDLAATQTATLPAATGSGNVYGFFVKTTKTGDLVIQVTTTDIIQGAVGVTTDAAGVNIPTAATSDTITMNGSTTGGLAGSYVELQDVASGVWSVRGVLNSSGAEATPFSANVS